MNKIRGFGARAKLTLSIVSRILFFFAMSNLSVECHNTKLYLSSVGAACSVGFLSSLLVILIVVCGKHYKKTFHRFFLYYSIATALLSTFELTEHVTCTHILPATPKLYQALVFITCYFSSAQLLLLCWISAYLLLVGVFQWVRLGGGKSEVAAMAVVLLLPTNCAWRQIYLAVTQSQQTYECGLSVTNTTFFIDDVFYAMLVEFLLCVISALTTLVTLAMLVRGARNRARPYHSDYGTSLKALLPVIVLLLVASIFGIISALSMITELEEECPALVTVNVMQYLIQLILGISFAICYFVLVYKRQIISLCRSCVSVAPDAERLVS